MDLTPLIAAGALRRALAMMVVIGQVLGTIGIIPVSAHPESTDSTPFPCKNHPCGCRTASLCWSSACCCFTMQEKIDWAARNGITPPEHALALAAQEARAVTKKTSTPISPCCSHSAASPETRVGLSCCESKSQAYEEDDGSLEKQSQSKVINIVTGKNSKAKMTWIAGFYAQKCSGSSSGGLGLLNVGVAPAIPPGPIVELDFVLRFVLIDLPPISRVTPPLLQPPKF